MEPTAEIINFPEGYGTPTETLAWSDVHARLEEAERYWLATTRADGRPHVVPTDGLWTADGFYFGGHSDTVHMRNLRRDQRAALHLEDAIAAVIVEGTAELIAPSRDDAERLAAASKSKYGWGSIDSYLSGVWLLRPTRVLAWNALNRDATRFNF
jgi:nitroimidazol reductase NimA-like FMN-containing flavoprotein (pyridoxamine 5'-phosphate oxidase superfamily)